jgi:hypothetical protein
MMIGLPKPPQAIRKLAQFGVAALRPTIANGRYSGPMVKPRVAAMVRKRALVEGTYGSFCNQFGGWLEEWDTQRKIFFPRVPKGHIRDRDRAKRATKITNAMADMPKKLEAHSQELKSRKLPRGPLHMFKNAQGVADTKEEEKAKGRKSTLVVKKKKTVVVKKKGKK